MRTKQIVAKCCSWMLLFSLLAACGTVPTPTVDNVEATKIVATFMAQITQTAAAADDLPATVEPTETLTGESPEEDETPVPTATPEPYKALLDRFRMVSVINGKLFVRDGTGLPVQITKSGADHDPVISADGQKIVFYRGEGNYEVFVVNADGSGEKALIKETTLSAKTKNKILSPIFRSGTTQLLFSKYICEDTKCEMRVFLARTESSAITELVNGLPVQRNLDNAVFTVSPDGQYMVVNNSGQLDLYSMDGKIVQANIVRNVHASYWLSDSSGLIVLSAGRGDYTIWRYTLKDQHVEKILLDPTPAFDEDIACYLSISPDRNWILYQDHNQQKRIGNLKDAKTQAYAWDSDCTVKWSPDSQHFASQTAIGSVDGTPSITIDGHFIAWLDDTHYLFTKGKNLLDLQSYIAEVGKESAAVQTNFIWSPVYAVLP